MYLALAQTRRKIADCWLLPWPSYEDAWWGLRAVSDLSQSKALPYAESGRNSESIDQGKIKIYRIYNFFIPWILIKFLTQVGFQILENEDMTARGIEYLNDELARLENQREDTIAQLEGSKENRVRQYEEMVTDLKFKIRCSTSGEETWGLIIARKP